MIRLVVGLGNPGIKYRNTPHNVGYEVVEMLADRHRGDWRESRRFRAALAQIEINDHPVLLAEPLTYMNLSGEAVAPLVRYHNIELPEILVVCDDVNLAMGRIRLRPDGSHGGQKGLLSIIQALGSTEFPRLRIGIDSGEPIHDLVEYVLTPWWGEARESMRIVCDRAADAVERVITTNLKLVMSEYNGRDFFASAGQ
jgi:PTH1 family peptidyl-tRNA hydrolase